MEKVGSLLNWIGGGVSRATATSLVTGIFFIVFGMTPAEAVAYIGRCPPDWLMSGWTRLVVLVLGIAVVWVSLHFNRWSRKQLAINSLAQDISWAISDLLNRQPRPQSDQEIATWQSDYRTWCKKVSNQLQNRAFFTQADQLFTLTDWGLLIPWSCQVNLGWIGCWASLG
jgi:hypothetical protein